MVEALTLYGLTVSVPGESPLLDGVSLSIGAGERVGLVGASGSGKSLTAATLTGLLRPPLTVTGGTLCIEGHEICPVSSKVWRKLRGRSIFQIFQSPGTALTPARRIGTQLAEAARIACRPAMATVAHALDTVALSPAVAHQFPHQLSGGMKQRVLIAMALILRPRILIADEPTTGLDVLTERGVLAALNAMANETGCAVLFISHDLRAVAEVASRTLIMESGKIVEDAPIGALTRSGVPAARNLAEAAQALQATC